MIIRLLNRFLNIFGFTLANSEVYDFLEASHQDRVESHNKKLEEMDEVKIEEFSLTNKVDLLKKNIDIEWVHPLAILNVNELLFQRFSKQEQLQILTDYVAQIWISDSKEENDQAFCDVVLKIIKKRRQNP